jgi:hypothetical protein
MPKGLKGPKGERRPADSIARAVKVMRIPTDEEPEHHGNAPKKNKAAQELGKAGRSAQRS